MLVKFISKKLLNNFSLSQSCFKHKLKRSNRRAPEKSRRTSHGLGRSATSKPHRFSRVRPRVRGSAELCAQREKLESQPGGVQPLVSGPKLAG